MTIIAQNKENEQRKISATLKKFYDDYGVAGLLRACRSEKQKGVFAFRIFQHLLCLMFSDRSKYMQLVPEAHYRSILQEHAIPLSQRREDKLGAVCAAAVRANHQPNNPPADGKRPQGCVHH